MEQITIKILEGDKNLIINASNLLGVGHSTFSRMVILKEARKILKDNKEDSE